MVKIVLKKGQNVFITSDTHYNHKNICKGVSEWDLKRQNNSVRDFRDLHHMNSTIVNNINSVVGEDDILIHLGDWSFGGIEQIWEFRKQIICKNIYLIYGNHDHHIFDNKILPNCHTDFVDLGEGKPVVEKVLDGRWDSKYGDGRDEMFQTSAQELFTWSGYYGEFEFVFHNDVPNQKAKRFKFVASHYPMASWNEMGKGRVHLYGHIHSNPTRIKYKSIDVGVDGNNFFPYNINQIMRIMSKQEIGSIIKDDHHV